MKPERCDADHEKNNRSAADVSGRVHRGPNGELDWALTEDEQTWKDVFAMLRSVDTCILGRVMYPEYEQYWMAVLANPGGPLPLSGKPATKNEIAYARWADKTAHIVVSKILDKVAWKTTRIVRDIKEIRKLKQQTGKDMHVVGGATLVSSLMNARLIDEVRLMVNPIVLGGGKALFKDVDSRQTAYEYVRIVNSPAVSHYGYRLKR